MLRRAAATWAALVLLTSAAVVAPTAARADDTGCQAGQPCVVVTWSGSVGGHEVSDRHVFDEATIAGMIGGSSEDVEYPLCSEFPANCPPVHQFQASTGVSIRSLILALDAHFEPEQVISADIDDGQGRHATLQGDTHDFDSSDSALFPFEALHDYSPKLYPIIYPSGGGSTATYDYARSLRSDVPLGQDLNGADNDLQTGVDGTMTVTLRVHSESRLLKPTFTVSPTPIKVKHKVTFSASVPGGAPTNATYSWYDQGQRLLGTGNPLRYRFSTAGSYLIYVQVSGDGAAGRSTEKLVKVGSPAKDGPPGPGGGTGDSKAPVVGPNKGTGVHAGARPDAPSSGPYGASTGAHTDAAGHDQGTASPTATPTKTRRAAVQNDRGFVNVNGILLNPAAATLQPSAQRQAGQPETAPAARAGAPERRSIVFGVGLGSAVLALLVLGVVGESRRPGRSGRRRSHP